MADPTPTYTRTDIRGLSDAALRQLEDGFFGGSSGPVVSDATARLIYDELAARRLSTLRAEQLGAERGFAPGGAPAAGFFPAAGAPRVGDDPAKKYVLDGLSEAIIGGAGSVLTGAYLATVDEQVRLRNLVYGLAVENLISNGVIDGLFGGLNADARRLFETYRANRIQDLLRSGVIKFGPGGYYLASADAVDAANNAAITIIHGFMDGVIPPVGNNQQPANGFVEVPGANPVTLPGAAIAVGVGGLPGQDAPGAPIPGRNKIVIPPDLDNRGNRLPVPGIPDGFFGANPADP